MMLTPNTSYDGDTGLVSIAGQQGGEDSGYANGNGSNAFTVDGSNATSNYFADIVGRNRIPYLYGENVIEEFQVAVSPYTALYGCLLYTSIPMPVPGKTLATWVSD